jgi:hypothetical protein
MAPHVPVTKTQEVPPSAIRYLRRKAAGNPSGESVAHAPYLRAKRSDYTMTPRSGMTAPSPAALGMRRSRERRRRGAVIVKLEIGPNMTTDLVALG